MGVAVSVPLEVFSRSRVRRAALQVCALLAAAVHVPVAAVAVTVSPVMAAVASAPPGATPETPVAPEADVDTDGPIEPHPSGSPVWSIVSGAIVLVVAGAVVVTMRRRTGNDSPDTGTTGR